MAPLHGLPHSTATTACPKHNLARNSTVPPSPQPIPLCPVCKTGGTHSMCPPRLCAPPPGASQMSYSLLRPLPHVSCAPSLPTIGGWGQIKVPAVWKGVGARAGALNCPPPTALSPPAFSFPSPQTYLL